MYGAISEESYQKACDWCDDIEKKTEIVDTGWIEGYNEAAPGPGRGKAKGKKDSNSDVRSLPLPSMIGAEDALGLRRKQMKAAEGTIANLQKLFRRCASGKITSETFYGQLTSHWGYEVGNRFQGAGFEIKGKHSDFTRLSKSILKILDAAINRRDDIVRAQMDGLAEDEVSTRGAFLSEMLCQFFPNEYPILNKPVFTYLRNMEFRPTRNASEGARYIYLAKTLRSSLARNPRYEAKNLAELDAVVWYHSNAKNA